MRTTPLVSCLVLAVANTSMFGQSVRDSAGIRVVDHGSRLAPRTWQLDWRPLLSIGGSDGIGPTEFSDVRGIARLANGLGAVANGATGEIRIFSPRGIFIRSHGRSGPGPGEFTRLHGLLRSGDTLIGIDADGRGQAFISQGSLTRSLMPLRPPAARNAQRLGVRPNGTFYVTMLEDPPAPRAVDYEVTLAVALSTMPGDSIVTIVRLKAYSMSNVSNRSVRRLLDASGAVTVNADRVCAGFSDRFDLICYDSKGKPVLRIVRRLKRESVTDSDREQVRAAYLAANRDAPEAIRRQMERAVLDFPFSELRPVYGRLLLSTTGELWVGPFDSGYGLPGHPAGHAPKTTQRWSVFAQDGAWLADVDVPRRFVALEVGGDYVAGVAVDDDDAERVVVLRIIRR